MATCPARTRERTVRVGREALRYQGGEAATRAPVKRLTAGSNPAPGADRKVRDDCPHRLAGQGRRPLKAETRVRIPVGTCARVDQQRGRHSFKVEMAGQHRPRVRARVRWMDRSPSKRSRAGSSPAGRTRPRSPIGRTPRYERGGWRFESSRGYETRAWFNRRMPARLAGDAGATPSARTARVAQQESAGPTSRRRGRNSLRAYRPQVRKHHCFRKHLVRLPGCLPGEAGSIPVGSAKPGEARWCEQPLYKRTDRVRSPTPG